MNTSISKLGKILLVLAGCSQVAAGANDSVVTAVFSTVSNGYVRERLSDGSAKAEYYVVANGGPMPGTVPNSSGDNVAFPDLVRLISGYLAKSNFLPAPEAKSADLMLVLSWGTTIPFNDAPQKTGAEGMFAAMNNLNAANEAVKQSEAQGEAPRSADGIQSPTRSVRDAAGSSLEGQLFQMQMFSSMRTKADEQNARLLGYVGEINRQNNVARFAGGGTSYDDLISDIESERYYVIVTAFDYRVAAQEKKSRVLWTTRISVQTQGNRFKNTLATMLANAAPHFGQNSGRLIRQYQKGTVTLGELKFIETVPDATPPAKPPEEK